MRGGIISPFFYFFGKGRDYLLVFVVENIEAMRCDKFEDFVKFILL